MDKTNKSGIVPNLSNEDYHALPSFFSSSQLKLILQSPELYHKKYITKELKDESKDAFDTGTAIHLRILEPDKYKQKVVFFSGTRRGKVWNEFKEANNDKLILGDLQKIQIDKMFASFEKSPFAKELISGGASEVSLLIDLSDTSIKVRADYLNIPANIIVDLKSASGMIEEDKFRQGAESKLYGYDLQAALYVDAYTAQFPNEVEFKFYWIVMSKDFDSLKIFKATSELIEQGRQKYKRAIVLIRQYEAEGWTSINKGIIELYPSSFLVTDF